MSASAAGKHVFRLRGNNLAGLIKSGKAYRDTELSQALVVISKYIGIMP